MRASKRILNAIQDALLFVDAGEWQQDEHGDVTRKDYDAALAWVAERLARSKGGV